MIKSEICHRVLIFEISHVENHRIEQIVALFRTKQSRKEESNSDSFCNTMTGIFVVLVFKVPKF